MLHIQKVLGLSGLFIVSLALTQLTAVGQNKLIIVHATGARAAVVLENTDEIGGIQFTINAVGGARLTDLKSGSRTRTDGWQQYWHLKDESTLNVLLLAPPSRQWLSGKGTIVEVSYSLPFPATAEPIQLFLSNTEIVDPSARILPVSIGEPLRLDPSYLSGEGFRFALGQNFPNPFNPSTTLPYRLEESGHVSLSIYDVTGRRVRVLVNGTLPAGDHQAQWDGLDESSRPLSSGTYFALLRVANHTATRKLVLTR